MVNRRLMGIRSCSRALKRRGLNRESCAGATDVVTSAPQLAVKEWRPAPLPFNGARAGQNVQPSAVSEAFVASRVCLQVASMVAFVDGFFAMSIHVLRVWSICVLYIARCASGTLETMQASYLVRKSSQGMIPVLCA